MKRYRVHVACSWIGVMASILKSEWLRSVGLVCCWFVVCFGMRCSGVGGLECSGCWLDIAWGCQWMRTWVLGLGCRRRRRFGALRWSWASGSCCTHFRLSLAFSPSKSLLRNSSFSTLPPLHLCIAEWLNAAMMSSALAERYTEILLSFGLRLTNTFEERSWSRRNLNCSSLCFEWYSHCCKVPQ